MYGYITQMKQLAVQLDLLPLKGRTDSQTSHSLQNTVF